MPIGINKLSLNKYFNNKTILPNFRFYVTIIDKCQFGLGDPEVMQRSGIMPVLEPYHILNVTLPGAYNYTKEVQKYGSMVRSTPVMTGDGLEIPMLLEEDAYGRVGAFINTLQLRVMDKNCLYTAPNKAKLDRMVVTVENTQGLIVAIYTFKKVYLLRADQSEYSYSSSDSVKWNVTFNADYYDVIFPLSIIGPAIELAGDIADKIEN